MAQSHAPECPKVRGHTSLRESSGVARGQVLLLAAMAMVVLIGFVALATDVGLLSTERRQMQTAADAAAIAASAALRNSQSYASAADEVASLNGFTNGTNSATITVNNPPMSGAYIGNSNYVEVVIAQPEPTYFLRALGYASMNVSTRAVSGAVNSPACVYALDTSASKAINLTGSGFNINASCGVIDNSTSASALSATGTGTVTASSIGVAGNDSVTGSLTFVPTPKVNTAPVADPLASLQAPAVGSPAQQSVTNSGAYSVSGNNQTIIIPAAVYSSGISIAGSSDVVTFSGGTYGDHISITGSSDGVTFNPGQYQHASTGHSIDVSGNAATISFNPGTYTFLGSVNIVGSSTVTLQPGTYFGGIAITGQANVTFSPGTYILAGGGLSVTGTSSLSGSGVTFYDTNATGYAYGPISLTGGNATADLSAPTSGAMKGILFFQDRSIPAGSDGSSLTGNVSNIFDGAIYFPTTGLTYTGNSSTSGYTFLIADTLTLTGSQITMTLGSNYSSLTDGSPIQSSTLYE
jgi:hypothetical protein